MEVLGWDHQAKAATQRFPSISDSTCCMTLAKLLVTRLAEAPDTLLQIRSVHPLCSTAPRKRKQTLPEHLPGTKLHCSPGQPDGVAPGGRCTSTRAAAPTPSPSSPRVPAPSSADRCLPGGARDEAGGQQTSVLHFKLISALCSRCLFPCL